MKTQINKLNSYQNSEDKNPNNWNKEYKTNKIQRIFSKVSDKYDLMNDLMSLGMHRIWKRSFLSEIKNYDSNILDMASGTGDIGINICKYAKKNQKQTIITFADPNINMLKKAEDRAFDLNFFKNVKFVQTSAENLPFEDNFFDYYLISFGIRNVSDIEKSLCEAYRVLKPTGKFICMEFGKVKNDLLNKIYKKYSYNIIPNIGQFITGSKDEYQYLVDSIEYFYNQNEFIDIMKKSNFKNIKYNDLSLGISTIFTGYKY